MIVVLVDPRRPSLVPVEAIEQLTGEIQYTEEMPVAVPWSLPAARPVHTGDDAPVLLSSDPDHPAVTARLAAGARLISAPETPRGERLVDAVAMMDKLRTAGPWESEQTHDSLRRFLLEETYELFDAVRSGNADAAARRTRRRVAAGALSRPHRRGGAASFRSTIDEVAATLMRKLANRVPGVLAGESISLEEQLAQWEERKAAEKPRNSVMDDVPYRSAGFGAGAEGGSTRACGRSARRSDSRRDHLDLRADRRRCGKLLAHSGFGVRGHGPRRSRRSIAATRRGDSVPEEFDVAPLGEVTEAEWREHWPSDAVEDGRGRGRRRGHRRGRGRRRSRRCGEDAGDAEEESGKESKRSGKGSKRSRDRG